MMISRMSLVRTTLGITAVLTSLQGLPAIASQPDLKRLDRGHRILIQKGLQLAARAYGLGAEDQENDSEFWKTWKASNFTTIMGDSSVVAPKSKILKDKVSWIAWFPNQQDPTKSVLKSLIEKDEVQELVGWQYKDEQDLGQSNELKELQKWISHYRKLLPNTLLYTNQGGDERFGANGSTSDYNIRRYMQLIKPDILMQDTYPYGVWKDLGNQGGRPAQYYYAMIRYRRLALAGHDGSGQNPIPYGLWTQSFKGRLWSRFPSASELSLQQFSALTLGYKMMSAFVYNHSGKSRNAFYSPFFNQGSSQSPTLAFHQMAEINRQSLNLGPTLVRLLSQDVRIVPKPPTPSDLIAPNIPKWDANADPYITRLEVQNLGSIYGGRRGDVLVGYFKPLLESFDGPAQHQQYFMITNGLAGKKHTIAQTRQKLTIEFDFEGSSITGIQRLSRDTGKVESIQAGWTENVSPEVTSSFIDLGNQQYRLTLILDGGTGDLFKFDTGAPFVGQTSIHKEDQI